MDGQTAGWMDGWTDGRTDGQMDGQTDGWTDGRMENLPILQDFISYRGRCPKNLLLTANALNVDTNTTLVEHKANLPPFSLPF